MTIHQGLEFLWLLWFAREHHKWWGLGLRTNRLAMFTAWEPKAKLLRSSWNWNLVKPNLSHSGIPLCKICRTALPLGCSNFMWRQPSECPEGLARSNWNAAFISLRELQILWLGWSQMKEVPNSPKTKMINGVLLLVFPCPNAQTLGTWLTAWFHLPSGNRGKFAWTAQVYDFGWFGLSRTVQIPLAGCQWYFRA